MVAAEPQRGFDDLKAALTFAPVLREWDPARPTRLVTDASEQAVSGILEQPDDRGVYQPVGYESRKLTPPEHLLELLALVHCEFKFKVVHIPGRSNPSYFLFHMNFPSGSGHGPRFLAPDFSAAAGQAIR